MPIKQCNAAFLEDIALLEDDSRDFFDQNSRNGIAIRKFQSAGILNLEEKWLERSRAAERNLFETDFKEENVESSSYSVSEIPTRATNPLVFDSKFRETDIKKNFLEPFNTNASIEVLGDSLY
eukprot:CAMPEP_0176446234 /NCGR_PEP_ID=MMETSP0127-20121128/24195_1 /TAXON_ID=938130 /ORGANISM="Platyophrya macrostoma, Strain WH" /LENGTH=122 /DNA_ID=CAMNT_0017832211 /DNA_START=97 /DNA_END=465 /DNA_ORIENTATION=+